MKSLICILLVVVLAIGFYAGFFTAKATEMPLNIKLSSVDEVYDLPSFITFAKGQHQYYVDYPEKCHEWSGDSEWNLEVVGYYNEIEELLR